MKINRHIALSKVVAGETVYLIPIPNFVRGWNYRTKPATRRKNLTNITRYKVGITGWEDEGAETIGYAYDTARDIFDKLTDAYVTRLKENYRITRDAGTKFRSDFYVLALTARLPKNRGMRYR